MTFDCDGYAAERIQKAEELDENGEFLAAICELDMVIVVTGIADAPLAHIERIQKSIPSSPDAVDTIFGETVADIQVVSSAFNHVAEPETPPSFFLSSSLNAPFVLRGFCSDWPAISRWRSRNYLERVAGPGRTVPVEVGGNYTKASWSQRWMIWSEFLDSLPVSDTPEAESLYLAQHSLFAQMPALRDDLTPPDYVYASPQCSDSYPNYRPPGNEDQLVLNAWLGPKRTVSPAHIDPYYNCYAQVVGTKTAWLAPPSVTLPRSPDPALASTTTSLDVFGSIIPEEIASQAMWVTLHPGDLLVFPPGWWHAMRSESTSFSVSMWF